MHDPLVVDQHTIGNRIIVADNRVDEFVNEGVALKTEFFDSKLRNFRKETGARHVRMLAEPSPESGRYATGLWHSPDSGRMLHYALGFGLCMLTKQVNPLTATVSNPVLISLARYTK